MRLLRQQPGLWWAVAALRCAEILLVIFDLVRFGADEYPSLGGVAVPWCGILIFKLAFWDVLGWLILRRFGEVQPEHTAAVVEMSGDAASGRANSFSSFERCVFKLADLVNAVMCLATAVALGLAWVDNSAMDSTPAITLDALAIAETVGFVLTLAQACRQQAPVTATPSLVPLDAISIPGAVPLPALTWIATTCRRVTSDFTCTICMGDFHVKSTRPVRCPVDVAACRPCNHHFHSQCLRPWFFRTSNETSCPNCRASIECVEHGSMP
jgi:hypothetical protein